MPDDRYAHRDIVDKLGIEPGQRLTIVGDVEAGLQRRVRERVGEPQPSSQNNLDVVLIQVRRETETQDVLQEWSRHIQPAGAIWLLTAKRGSPNYVDQRVLIDAGAAAGLVDNKVCSVSESTSAMRFVFRKRDRPASGR